ncbi:hypothetical protein Fcan01_15534 [Folsomia candida]|uniref:Diacylglycerol O-acyltransferase n=1 Tax=Folsomia candida TaxID=158441 RepID=A0A226DVA0_FOLCA|nr:hypothetical protein Fcan01_15534 [Folsomia candida]
MPWMRPPWKTCLSSLLWKAYLCLIGITLIPVLVVVIVLVFTPTFIWRPISKMLRPIFRPDLAGMLSCTSSVFAQVDDEFCPAKAVNIAEITVKPYLTIARTSANPWAEGNTSTDSQHVPYRGPGASLSLIQAPAIPKSTSIQYTECWFQKLQPPPCFDPAPREGRDECFCLLAGPLNTLPWCRVLLGNLDLNEFIHHINKTWISCRDDASQNLRYPELQQYPVNWAGYKFWKWEEKFSLQNHIRFAPSGGDLTQMVVDLLSGTFPDGTSPWDFTIVPGHILQGEEQVTKIFLRVHHLLGDGFMIYFLLQRMLGDENPAPLFRPGVKRENSVWKSAKHSILFPYKAILLIGELAHSAVTRTIWKVPERRKGLTWSLARGQSIPARTILRIKNHFQVSFSAALYSLVAGGLRRFIDSELKHNGTKIPAIIPTVTPVPPGGRHPDRMGNQFSFCLISYATGPSDPVERLYEMHHKRYSAASVIGHYGFALLGSHVNWVARRVNSYPFGSLTTSYFPGGSSPEWNILGRPVLHEATTRPASMGNKEIFPNERKIVFMQDGAIAHTAKASLSLIKTQVSTVWSKGVWAANGPDLNPLKNQWSILKENVYKEPQPRTREELVKKSSRCMEFDFQRHIGKISTEP